ncbi:hypothetical protein KEJ21_00020 [Candidatus Bathyarchaeota archaeon]|nr:hypothetical protein [Candidatus Bathyarchaeota archaeon]MBS7630155.1 hypothetical protein [Candidatus Bathyarchaeota archaeon]
MKIRFVALGDSLTVGFQAPSPFLPGSEEFPYTSLLEDIVENELQRRKLSSVEFSFINAGLLGDTTQTMLERFEVHVMPKNPDYVIIWGGINDLFTMKTPSTVFSNLMKIYVKSKETKIEPIACTLAPVLGYDEILPKIRELNAMIMEHCRNEGIKIVDLYSSLADDTGRLRESFSSDGVHLSNAGYKKVAYAIYYNLIEKMLDDFKLKE